MKLARALGWLLLVAVALIVAAVSILFFINASDEPLNPEAYAALDPRFDSIPHQPIGSLNGTGVLSRVTIR
jgi:hypothetical protein